MPCYTYLMNPKIFAGPVFENTSTGIFLVALIVFALVAVGFIALIVWSIALLRKGETDKSRQLYGIIGLLIVLALLVVLQRVI